ncbi:MAG: LamG domain-containing protein [Gammaproteobacteria bacterium]
MKRLIRLLFLFTLIALLTACGQNNNGNPPSESIVGWWTFDESNNGQVADTSGQGNFATINNGGTGTGKIGTALQMDGGNDSIVTIPLSDSLRTTANAITIMGWAYRTAEHNVVIVAHGYPDLFLGFHGPGFKWQLENVNNKRAACYADDKKYKALLNEWYHVAGSYDGNTARLYVNGKQICKKWLWKGGDIKMPEKPFSISGFVDDDGKIVDEITGKIDDVRIYNQALTAKEIQEIYHLDNK